MMRLAPNHEESNKAGKKTVKKSSPVGKGLFFTLSTVGENPLYEFQSSICFLFIFSVAFENARPGGDGDLVRLYSPSLPA